MHKKSGKFFWFTALMCSNIYAHIVYVNTTTDVLKSMRDASAGDTIVIAPGIYTGDISESGDPSNLPNGIGFFWVGSDGSSLNPIVIISEQKDNPAVLQGNSLSSGYVVHVTGDHVILKNLVIRKADKGVVFDNSSFSIIEDCEIYNSGAELIHVRDSSCNVTISRNHIYSSGNAGRGSIGEGIYIGTDQARWGADDVPQSQWGEKAISEGYGGYDWRVHNTRVLCNYLSGGISAECLDIKEGTQNTLVHGNMLSGDSIGLKPGGESYDDSFIDQKGVKGIFTENSFCQCGNSINKYISEVTRASFTHVPDSLTTDGHSSPWCDSGDKDSNDCSAANNSIVTVATDPRESCLPIFDFNWDALVTIQSRDHKRFIENATWASISNVSNGNLLVKINNPGSYQNVSISLYNSRGQKVFNISRKQINQKSLFFYINQRDTHLTTGLYYLKIKTTGNSPVIPVLIHTI